MFPEIWGTLFWGPYNNIIRILLFILPQFIRFLAPSVLFRVLYWGPLFSETPTWSWKGSTVNPRKLETGLRPNSAGIPYPFLLRVEAIGFPTFTLLP